MSRKQIDGAEELMRIALNGQKNVDSLIGYYRDLIDEFNEERAQWAIYFENLKYNAADKHLLQQQAINAQSILTDLQNQLALQKAYLSEQRQRYFRALKEKEGSKIKLQNTKAQLRQVMSQLKPIQSTRIQKHQNNFSKETGNSNVTMSQLTLINLSKDHEAKKQLVLSRIRGLKEQLQEIISQHSQRGTLGGEKYLNALSKLSQLQKKNVELTMQFFRFRMDHLDEEQRLQQNNQIIRFKNIAQAQKLKSLQESHTEEFKTIDQEVKRNNQEFKKKYDLELKRKEQHLNLLKDQCQRIQDMHLIKVKSLEEQLQAFNNRLKNTEEKARFQVGTLKSQIKVLNGRLQKDGIQQMRSQLAQNEQESEESLPIQELDRLNKQVNNLQQRLNFQ